MDEYKKKIDLKKQISDLLPIQQNEIFNIILNKNINYTSNNNGVFINITNMEDTLIDEINNYINYIKNNEERLEKIENKCEDIYNNKSNDISNVYKIINFKEFTDLNKDNIPLNKLEKIKNEMNIKRKKEYHLKFINTMKKYQRLLCINNDFDNNINELKKMKYLIH